MLGKMIKHEFKATGRLILPLFLLVIVMTPVLALLNKLASHIGRKSLAGGLLSGISMVSFVAMMIGACVAVFIYIMVRFYKTIATSEAYMTFCLPVNSHHVMLSKLIVATVWQVLTVAIAIGSLYIMFIINGIIEPGTVFSHMERMLTSSGIEYGSLFGFLFKIGAMIFISMITSILSWYLAVCLGQIFQEKRVLMSIVMYMGIYMVMQIIYMCILLPFILSHSSEFTMGEAKAINMQMNAEFPSGLLLAVGIINIVLAVVFYVVGTQILKKKTNVR
ncbi:MAG: hypothetical protein IJM01_06090 [Eubacterium sp.]|nr:hypothetical protein [Eubacterium sp.]